MPFHFIILDIPFPRDDFVVIASRNALFIILFIFISENQTTFDVILPRCTYYILYKYKSSYTDVFIYIMMYFKQFLMKVNGNNVAAMFPQPIMFLIRAVIESSVIKCIKRQKGNKLHHKFAKIASNNFPSLSVLPVYVFILPINYSL